MRLRLLMVLFILVLANIRIPTDVLAQSNGDQIVYAVQTTSGSSDLYVMNADGSGAQQLTHNGASSSPVWSPGHRQIAYRFKQNDVADIYVMNANGSGAQQVTHDNGTNNDYPTWSPDSQQIAFVSNESGKSDIWTVNVGGGTAHQLTTSPNADAQSPAWSPDGRQIAYSTNSTHPIGNYEIYLMNADGTHAQRLTTSDGDSDSPAWSPDGQQIAYVSTQNGGSSILTIVVTGGQSSQVYEIPDGFIGTLSWSPDGKSLAFMVTDNKKAHSVRTVAISGAKTMQLTDANVQAGWPSWGALKPIAALDTNTGIGAVDNTGGTSPNAGAGTSAQASVDVSGLIPDLGGVILQVTHAGLRSSARSAASANATVLRVLFWGDRMLWKQKRVGNFKEVYLGDGQKAYISDKPEYVIQVDPAAVTPSLSVGVRVAVNDSGDGSHLRNNFSTKATELRTLRSGDVLTVIGGPQYAEYYIWWKLQLSDGTVGWHVDLPDWWRVKSDE